MWRIELFVCNKCEKQQEQTIENKKQLPEEECYYCKADKKELKLIMSASTYSKHATYTKWRM